MDIEMTQLERQWMQEARRSIRSALVSATNQNWDEVVACAASLARYPTGYLHDTILEVKDLLTSLATARSQDLRGNAAMRAAAITRLEEVKSLIGETLVATTDR